MYVCLSSGRTSRSLLLYLKKTAENLTMQVAWRTPLEKLDQLEKCMNNWLQTEENRWFQPSTSVTLQHIDYQRFLEITIGIPYNSNWQ